MTGRPVILKPFNPRKMRKEKITDGNRAVEMKYFIIDSNMYQYRRIYPEPLNQHTFFDLYAKVFSLQEVEAQNLDVISFDLGEELDEQMLGKGSFAVEIMDVFTLTAIERHHQKWYPNLIKCEEQRNEYVALQRSKQKSKVEAQKGKQLEIFSK
jgi:hypothetical protein